MGRGLAAPRTPPSISVLWGSPPTQNSSAWPSQHDGLGSPLYVQRSTAAVDVTLLAVAAGCRAAAAPLLLSACRAASDRYLMLAGPTAANPPRAAAAVDNWDRQTDTVPLHRPCHILFQQVNRGYQTPPPLRCGTRLVSQSEYTPPRCQIRAATC